MTKIAFLFTLLVTALVCLLPAAPAQATGAPRTFVSAAGSDANNCTNVATPCRHMAAAFAATAADGEIYVLDPANYGSLTITHAVSIEGHGWASIAPVANGNAININANPGDKINIIGVVLDGTAVTNTTGILFSGSGTLNVRDSVIRNFAFYGIDFHPAAASQLFVSNTLVSDNGNHGVFIDGTSANATGVLDHVTIQNNTNDGLHAQAGSPHTVNFTFSDSVSANNVVAGVLISSTAPGATIDLLVRNCTIADNAVGLASDNAGATLRVTRSSITGNNNPWGISSPGVIASYTDNNFDGNTTNNTAPPTTATYK